MNWIVELSRFNSLIQRFEILSYSMVNAEILMCIHGSYGFYGTPMGYGQMLKCSSHGKICILMCFCFD